MIEANTISSITMHNKDIAENTKRSVLESLKVLLFQLSVNTMNREKIKIYNRVNMMRIIPEGVSTISLGKCKK
jgi:hypothetical protein